MDEEILVITRHDALVKLLREKGFITDSQPTRIISHISKEEELIDKHVIGVLPLHMACLCASYATVNLSLPLDKRGKELTIDELRKYYRSFDIYSIERLERKY